MLTCYGVATRRIRRIWELRAQDGRTRPQNALKRPMSSLGWLYWLPNPLFPFIWYRVAVPRNHPDLTVEEV